MRSVEGRSGAQTRTLLEFCGPHAPMYSLAISIGNPSRRDDGVAHQVLKELNCDALSAIQLLPETAGKLARYDTVVFIDADPRAEDVTIEIIKDEPCAGPFTHQLSPAALVSLARELFRFNGKAYLCRIPVNDLSVGEGISRPARRFARRAAKFLAPLLETRRKR